MRAALCAGVFGLGILAAFPSGAAAADPSVAAALATLAHRPPVRRIVTLRDLGFIHPIVLNANDARRDLYLPVPVGVPLQGATLDLDAHFLRADGGRTTFVLSLDGYPVAARAPDRRSGAFSIEIGVDDTVRQSGFLRLGTAWSSAIDRRHCGDKQGIGNVLEIDPSTRLTYQFDPAGIDSLFSAWSALPASPTILITAKALGAEAYDAAWRVGLALVRAGKDPRFVALPTVGDQVNLSDIKVPPGLMAVPAFAALGTGGMHRLASSAEVGAYLLLAGGRLAQLAIADPTFTTAIAGDLDAVGAAIGAAEPGSKAAFEALRRSGNSLAVPPTARDAISLATLGGVPLIAIAPAAAPKTGAIFSALWRELTRTRRLVVAAAKVPRGASKKIALAHFGGTSDTFDVLARGEWDASFTLAALSASGRLPSQLTVDVAAAPGAGVSRPVVSIFLNDDLLAAKRLYADGQPESITAPVPRYALRQSNVLRVVFQRQPATDGCVELPQAFPVSILPSSYVTLAAPGHRGDFLDVVPRLAGPSSLLLPTADLAHATDTLRTVTELAASAGLSPRRATLRLVGTSADGATSSPVPDTPFLAIGVDIPLPKDRYVSVAAGQLVLAANPSKPLLKVEGLDHLGVIQAVDRDMPGLIYHQIGATGPRLNAPVSLADGDIAVISDSGRTIALDSRDSANDRPAAASSAEWSWSRLWQDRDQWGVPVAAAAVVITLLLFVRAAAVRRRRNRE